MSLDQALPTIIKYALAALITGLLWQPAIAQLCTGSLGDPVVNINFGSGTNPIGPSLGILSTNYTYITQPCPADGSYTITNNVNGCFNNTWLNLPEDHTPGDVNGYMMLVNASYNPGVFYADTVRNLCGGTTYEFSAWLINVLRPSACMFNGNKPNISFIIETPNGTLIQRYDTGDIPNVGFTQWNQYGFYFTLPANYSDLVLRLVNNAPGGCGNDLALDDITFRPCGPTVSAAFVNVTASNDTVDYCITDNKNISLTGNLQAGYNNPAIQWQQSTDSGKTWTDLTGVTGNSYSKTFTSAGRFQYRMTAAEKGNIGIARCRVASNVLTINIDNIPVPNAASSSPACVDAPLSFSAKNGDYFAWTGPAGFIANSASPSINKATLANAGTYYVLVSTKGGCSKTDSTRVIVSLPPVANAGPDSTVCEGKFIMLQASGGVQYRWKPASSLSDSTIANPLAHPNSNTTYTVTVKNQY
ncbi:MAG TPA: hypothetical protein VL307_08260, partial [Chitinophagaceae bacterium]|nr:hypothetical protein [Chitinophagaceae bacterium]